MRRFALALCLSILAATSALAQKSSLESLGKWKGESLCTVKPSACHDETVVYEFTRVRDNEKQLVWKADKIVNGEQQNMGSLPCAAPTPTTVSCDMPGRGVWELQVKGDVMTGVLRLTAGTVFRNVTAKRM